MEELDSNLFVLKMDVPTATTDAAIARSARVRPSAASPARGRSSSRNDRSQSIESLLRTGADPSERARELHTRLRAEPREATDSLWTDDDGLDSGRPAMRQAPQVLEVLEAWWDTAQRSHARSRRQRQQRLQQEEEKRLLKQQQEAEHEAHAALQAPVPPLPPPLPLPPRPPQRPPPPPPRPPCAA